MLALGSQSAMGMPWVHCRPNNKASGCSQETAEHPLRQRDLAVLPEGLDVGGGTCCCVAGRSGPLGNVLLLGVGEI